MRIIEIFSSPTIPLDEIIKTANHYIPDGDPSFMRRHAAGNEVGKVENIVVRLDITTSSYAYLNLVDGDAVVGFADFTRKPDGSLWVNMSKVKAEYRGRYLLAKAFLLLARQLHNTIVSDQQQTKAAISMWRYLYENAAQHGCEIVALNPITGKTEALQSATKTVKGRLIYGRSSPYRLVLRAPIQSESAPQ